MRRLGLGAILWAAMLVATVCGDERRTTIEAVGTVAEYTFLVKDGQYFLVDFSKLQFVPVRVTFLVPPGTPPVTPDPGPGPGPVDPPPKPPPSDKKVTRVTYVFEKDRTAIPRPVALALQKLNAQGITASEFEEDTVDGSGTTPAQYIIALNAGRQAGLPALVVQSGLMVLRVVANPTTEAEVMEAAK